LFYLFVFRISNFTLWCCTKCS